MLRLPISAEKPDLGLSLQWSPITLTEQVWHILDVTANSPADKAGLLPYSDYVIGSPAGVMRGESGLPELIEHHIDRPLPLYIYNHESDVTRPLTITPSRTWGGVGALGCVLGYGALHRLPQPLTAGPAPDPGETFFDHNAGDVQQPIDPIGDSGTFVPASELFGAAPAPSESPEVPHPERNSDSPVPVRTSKPKRAQPKAIVPALDDYFDEGEKESKQLDYALGPKPAADGIAPPPKRGT